MSAPLTANQMARKLRVLAIDGGGLRGIFSLRLLLAIEERCGRPLFEIFDYVIGTSTGGIIALALFDRRLSIQDTIALYDRLGREAFVKKMTGTYAYDHRKLENILKRELGEEVMTDDEDKYVAVVSHRWDQTPNRLALMANYSCDGFEHVRCKAWEAARATSAAPTYFEPAVVGGHQYVDGGLVANNPTLVGYTEAVKLGDVMCVVSVGNGRRPTDVASRSSNPWIWNLANHVVSGSLEASADLQHVVAQSFFDYLDVPFVRLDGTVRHVAFDDPDKAKSWKAAADELLRDRVFAENLNTFCDRYLKIIVPPSPPVSSAKKRRQARVWRDQQDDDDLGNPP